MGLFGKIKNIFYDIEEVEVPSEKEEKKPKEKKEKKEEVKEVKISPIVEENEPTNERELFKSKNTFNFPIFDSDEEEIKPKEEVKEPVPDIQKELIRRETRVENDYSQSSLVNNNREKRERKVFTPIRRLRPCFLLPARG